MKKDESKTLEIIGSGKLYEKGGGRSTHIKATFPVTFTLETDYSLSYYNKL